ncbi:FUSC family protein [Pseudomonas sp. CBS]|uniref:FUSC family protein n=1 Tax=unclassified Pseudomonas TaxID=196821 RepID=UPI0021ACE6E2|nr:MULTISPECIES: FUSC family protein [unclassified Pseudomonas]UVH53272.1 FUSC family protein [Pseudomonas sp. CBS]WEL79343.1 FUSC family protein [Pseudomonas sp. CBSPAW29]WEL81997.1 FUSC family protein [Pseudomonas sp. CBSPCAW29]
MKSSTFQLPDFWQATLTPSRNDLLFALRNMIAGGVALYLAFCFDLQQPQWALTTVFIVGQSTSGMVLAKGAYRLVGTFVGAMVSIAMIGVFGQAPLLFLLCMALWLAFCTTGASLLRNHASYGFVLAGYTTAIIALPATAAPLGVFDEAVARCQEISLGILCASIASTILWPRRVEQVLAVQARAAWQAGVRAAASELLGNDQRKGLLEALSRLVAVDSQRDHAWFEGPKGRRRSQALRVLSRDLLSLLRAARGVARQRMMLDETAAVVPLIEEVAAALQQERLHDLPDLSRRLGLALQAPHLGQEVHFCLMQLARVLRLIELGGLTLVAVEQGRVPPGAPGAMSWHRDIEQGVLGGLRSALAFLAVAAFWIFTAWPSGLGAVSICGVVLSLFAARENPSASSLNFLKGIALSIPVAGFVCFVLLPGFDGFPLLCLALGVPLFFASLCMSRLKLAATASAFCIFFVNNVGPSNVMTYDFAAFLNKAIATLVGVGIAVVVFRLIQLNPGEHHYRRMFKASLFDLAQLTSRPLEQAESWFGGRTADRLIRLSRYSETLPADRRAHWDNGLLGLDLGDELLELRACLAGSRGALAIERDRYLRALEAALEEGGPSVANESLMDAASVAMLEALEQPSALTEQDREMARAAVLQLRFTWRKWCRRGM